eukprot:2166144-Pyramimonas_sp.AAC.1
MREHAHPLYVNAAWAARTLSITGQIRFQTRLASAVAPARAPRMRKVQLNDHPPPPPVAPPLPSPRLPS